MDIWPYSGRKAGSVSDAEHESLWSWVRDGVLPGQAPTAGQVSVNSSSRSWAVTSVNLMVHGHVLQIDAQSGILDANTGTARRDLIVGFIDRSQSPWTYGVGVHTGTPGAGTPVVTQTDTGLWEVPLGEVQVLNTGATTLLADRRPTVRRGAQAYGPGLAIAGTFALATVCQLQITPVNHDRLLMVSGGLYTLPDAGTVGEAQLLQDAATVNGGYSIGGAAGHYTHALSAAPILLPAGGVTLFTIRIQTYTGGGRVTVVADSRLNHLECLAVPA